MLVVAPYHSLPRMQVEVQLQGMTEAHLEWWLEVSYVLHWTFSLCFPEDA